MNNDNNTINQTTHNNYFFGKEIATFENKAISIILINNIISIIQE